MSVPMPISIATRLSAIAGSSCGCACLYHATVVMQADLFAASPRLPEGFVYQPEFLPPDEEAALLQVVRTLPLEEAKYKEYTARRRTASYGSQYDFSENKVLAAPPLPAYLFPLRARVAAWVCVEPEQFVHALV